VLGLKARKNKPRSRFGKPGVVPGPVFLFEDLLLVRGFLW
jgi:hypothetical protein